MISIVCIYIYIYIYIYNFPLHTSIYGSMQVSARCYFSRLMVTSSVQLAAQFFPCSVGHIIFTMLFLSRHRSAISAKSSFLDISGLIGTGHFSQLLAFLRAARHGVCKWSTDMPSVAEISLTLSLVLLLLPCHLMFPSPNSHAFVRPSPVSLSIGSGLILGSPLACTLQEVATVVTSWLQ